MHYEAHKILKTAQVMGLIWDLDIGLGLVKSIHFSFTGVNYPNYAKDFSFHSLTLSGLTMLSVLISVVQGVS